MNKHISEIDSLRGVAIFLTLIAHLAFMQPTISSIYLYIINHIAQFWGGVHLFFVISGYVISRSFMDKFSKKYTPEKLNYLVECKKFYLRRFFRIIPTAMFWILFTLVVAINFNTHESFGTNKSIYIQAAAAATFVYNALTPWIAGSAYGIYWSLSFEEQFYLLFPIFSRKAERFKLIFLIAIIFIFSYIHRPANQNLIMVSFPLDAICWGVLIALVQKNKWVERFEPSFLSKIQFSFLNIVGALSVIILSPILLRNYVFGTSVLELSAAWLVFCASYNKGYIYSVGIIGSLFRKLGRVSFSLYCAHMPAYLITREIIISMGNNYYPSIQNWIALGISLTICFFFSTLSYTFIEKPTRLFGRKYINSAMNQPPKIEAEEQLNIV